MLSLSLDYFLVSDYILVRYFGTSRPPKIELPLLTGAQVCPKILFTGGSPERKQTSYTPSVDP